MVAVRSAARSDAESIRRVLVEAFPTSMEADLVAQIERDGDAVISLVACDKDAVAGHILLSRMRAEAGGRELNALGLAPVAVLPERQGQGIGSKLIEEGLRLAQGIGVDIVFVLGDPRYYGRFGFAAETAQPFASPYSGEHFQAKTLRGDVALPASGRADYAPAFAGLE